MVLIKGNMLVSGGKITFTPIPPVFDFASFPGYFAEYDADLGITLGTGSSVSGWADQSINGYDLAQATAGLQPTLITADANFNGHNSVSGDGTERIQASIGTEVNGNDSSITVYLVCRWNSSSQAFKRAAGFYNSGSSLPEWYFGTGFGSRTAMSKRDDTGVGTEYDQPSNLIDTNPHVMTWRHSGTQYDMWEDGTSVASQTVDAGTITVNRIQVFAVESIANANIRFARLIFYNAAHSTDDRTAIQNELMTIYGL